MLGVLARTDGDLTTARTELEHSIALAEELDEAPAQVAALNNLALAERDDGELDRALELTGRARELCAVTATVIERPRSRTTSPTSITRLAATMRRWPI